MITTSASIRSCHHHHNPHPSYPHHHNHQPLPPPPSPYHHSETIVIPINKSLSSSSSSSSSTMRPSPIPLPLSSLPAPSPRPLPPPPRIIVRPPSEERLFPLNNEQQIKKYDNVEIDISNLSISNNKNYDDDLRKIPIGTTYRWYVSRWKRFTTTDGWMLIRPTPLSSDIVQGILGNCWFLSALALVAERPELLRQILLSSNEDFARTGNAVIRLFRYGQWQTILVDSQLPVNGREQLVFSEAKRRQLFVPLIEKAMAKLYGGYDQLRGGLISEGMTTLTGFPCEILWLPPNHRELRSSSYRHQQQQQKHQNHSHHRHKYLHERRRSSTEMYPQQDNESLDEYWIKMLSYNSAGFLLGVCCGRSSLSTTTLSSSSSSSFFSGTVSSSSSSSSNIEPENSSQNSTTTKTATTTTDHYRSMGLLKEHAYSVLDVVSIGTLRLVKLRNPWGSIVWNGDWSDRSDCWQAYTELRHQLVPEGAEEGIFWISFTDLCRYFETVIVCKIQPNWYQYDPIVAPFPSSSLPPSSSSSSSSSIDPKTGKKVFRKQQQQQWTAFELMVDEKASSSQSTTCAQVSVTSYQMCIDDNDDDGSNTTSATTTQLLSQFICIYELLNSTTTLNYVINNQHRSSLTGASVCNAQRSVTCECELRLGVRYVMVVFGFNNWYTSDTTITTGDDVSSGSGQGSSSSSIKYSTHYTIRLHSSQPIVIRKFVPTSVLLGDVLIGYVKSFGKPIQRLNVITYQLNTNWAGLVSVVENLDPRLWLQVSMRTSLKRSTTGGVAGIPFINQNQNDNNDTNGSGDGDKSSTMITTMDYLDYDDHHRHHNHHHYHHHNENGDNIISMRDSHCYLASTRNSLITKDFIPPGHCQLINVITNRRLITTHHISIKLNLRFHSLSQWLTAKRVQVQQKQQKRSEQRSYQAMMMMKMMEHHSNHYQSSTGTRWTKINNNVVAAAEEVTTDIDLNDLHSYIDPNWFHRPSIQQSSISNDNSSNSICGTGVSNEFIYGFHCPRPLRY